MARYRSGSTGPVQITENKPPDPLHRPEATTSWLTTLIERWGERFRAIPPRRLVAVGLACIVGVAVMSIVNGARRQSAEWGVTSAVLVAAHPIPQGIVVTDNDVELRFLPLALLPADPVGSLGAGWVTQAKIPTGQALTRGTLGLDRDGLDESERAVTLPLPLAPPNLSTGDLVEIFSIASTADQRATAKVVAPTARVAGIDDEGITVVVSAPQASRLLTALAVGSVEFARRPSHP